MTKITGNVRDHEYKITIDRDEVDRIPQPLSRRYWFSIAGHPYIEDGKYALHAEEGVFSWVDHEGYPVENELQIESLRGLGLNLFHWN